MQLLSLFMGLHSRVQVWAVIHTYHILCALLHHHFSILTFLGTHDGKKITSSVTLGGGSVIAWACTAASTTGLLLFDAAAAGTIVMRSQQSWTVIRKNNPRSISKQRKMG